MTPVKNDGQLNVRLPEEVLATLLKIEARHGVTPNEALRKLAVSAAAFFEKHGWFTFPAAVMPEHFQNPIFMEKTEEKNKPQSSSEAASALVKNEGQITAEFNRALRHDSFLDNARAKFAAGNPLTKAESEALSSEQGIPSKGLRGRRRKKSPRAVKSDAISPPRGSA